jgi:hypothetical protein
MDYSIRPRLGHGPRGRIGIRKIERQPLACCMAGRKHRHDLVSPALQR